MSVNIIYLDDPSNADQVVTALQQALDVVLNVEAVNNLLTRPPRTEKYQHVHSRGGGWAVANAALMKSIRNDSAWALFVHIYYGQGCSSSIPLAIVQRLRVGLRGTAYGGAFADDRTSQEFRFYMKLPREVFIQNPSGVVTLV